jgi:methionyl-tRNA formyltransferase
MRMAWVGFHAEGVPALAALLAAGAPIGGVLTLAPEQAARRSGVADYAGVCSQFGVPLHYVADVNGDPAVAVLTALAPDVLFVIGWHQILRPHVLALPKVGTIGAHASLLPKNRGSAPINWALINGERHTGNTLIWLAPDVDAGDIIDQTEFAVTPYDTCATLYRKVADSNRDMLLALLPALLTGERPGTPQILDDAPVLRRRRPVDGRVNWSVSSRVLYDFVRALTRPYPGAFSILDGTSFRIWSAALPPITETSPAVPGAVLGPVVSPVPEACGQAVATGRGTIVLLELEAADGTVLRGPALSEQRWIGKVWSDD